VRLTAKEDEQLVLLDWVFAVLLVLKGSGPEGKPTRHQAIFSI